ncbi:MAG TPA: DUF3376 domain-containing protein [Ilumatobacteraceae bacterium]
MTARRPRELRLALSMNGGVSLAVWIGGAVAEIDCLRRGDGFWGDLLEASGFQRRALVDVMTGASAGGLNAVLMAQAIRSDTPFVEFLPLWQDHADIDTLLKGPRHAGRSEPRALLKGEYFRESLRDALDKPPTAEPLDQDLAIFASATLVRPNPVEFRDVPGAPIAETRSDAYFHVARRGRAARGLDAFEPADRVVGNVDALALVGRATSSLPGLFEPVRFDRQTFGARLVGAFTKDRDSVEVMDGGVIDNVPISRAIRAIANSPAERRVRRVLLYLHPDPGGRRGASAHADPDTALEVVRSFFGKRKETIREDIELLRLHNDSVDRRGEEAEALLRSFAGRDHRVDTTERAALDRSVTAAMLLRAAIDPASEVTWHAPNVARLVPLIDDPGDPSKSELADDIRATVTSSDVLLAMAARRTALAIQRIVSSIAAADPTVEFEDAQPKIYELLLLCDVITSYQLARFLGHGAGSSATTRLTCSREELESVVIADSPQADGAIDDSTWKALASWDLSAVTPCSGGRHLREHLDFLTTQIIERIADPPKDMDCPAAEVLRNLKSGASTPADLDLALLPLAAEPIASDQPIEFVRIAGDVESPASEAFATHSGNGPKIAGLQLHHLGAFFDRDWRTNDWWWGRLDSVRALLDVALDDEAMKSLREGGFLAQHGFTENDTAVEDIKHWLVKKRQLELLEVRLGKQTDFDGATSSDAFVAWARKDRRLSSQLGRRTLTSTAIRGSITASKVVRAKTGKLAQVALTVSRPVLLAIAGSVLAGRRAAAAIAWTVCLMAAVRAKSQADSWVLWGIGVALCAAIAALVELKVRPTLTSPWKLWPYVYAAAGVVVGAFAILDKSSLEHDWRWWIIPPLAAGVSALMLFFWMRPWAAALLTTATAALYLLFSYAAVRQRDRHPLGGWPRAWMFHSLWVCWLIAILGIPIAIGFMPDSMLRPLPTRPHRTNTNP